MYTNMMLKHFFLLANQSHFFIEPHWEGGTTVYINGAGHKTKMAAMPIYIVKTFKNLLFSEPDGLRILHGASWSQDLQGLYN